MTMYKYILVSIFTMYCCFVIAEQSDPCLLTSLPIAKKMEVRHAKSIETPSIFLLHKDTKISVSNREIIRHIDKIKNPNIPYLKESTKLLKQQLINQTEQEKSLSIFEPDPNRHEGVDFQIAVNNYGFVSGAIQKALFDSKALVVLHETRVDTSLVTLRVGKDPEPLDEFSNVNILNFVSKGSIIYESCWLER